MSGSALELELRAQDLRAVISRQRDSIPTAAFCHRVEHDECLKLAGLGTSTDGNPCFDLELPALQDETIWRYSALMSKLEG